MCIFLKQMLFMQVREALLNGEWQVNSISSAVNFAALSLQAQRGSFDQIQQTEEFFREIFSELPSLYENSFQVYYINIR